MEAVGDFQTNSTANPAPQTDTCGLFGKLPQQGDFISHFLPAAFTDVWHAWLQGCLGVSKEQLGDTWLDFYLTSPVWRFSLMPTITHPQSVAGIMIPSVDEVGRYFPLTLVQIYNHTPWSAYLHGDAWFSQLESAALLALEEHTSYSNFIGNFEMLPSLQLPEFSNFETLHAQHSYAENFVVETPPGNSDQQLPLNLLHKAYQRIYGAYGIWWTQGSEHIAPTLLVNSGLPDAGQFAAMLDGNWQQWGWNLESILENKN